MVSQSSHSASSAPIEAGTESAIRTTIGPYGVFTVDQARDEAREHLRAMRKGIDPRAARKADEAAKVTLQQVCDAYVSPSWRCRRCRRFSP